MFKSDKNYPQTKQVRKRNIMEELKLQRKAEEFSYLLREWTEEGRIPKQKR